MVSITRPVPNAPLVKMNSGRITQPWLDYFLNVETLAENGGSISPIVPSLNLLAYDTPNTSGRIAQVEARTGALEIEVADGMRREPANLSSLFGRVDELTALTMGVHNPIATGGATGPAGPTGPTGPTQGFIAGLTLSNDVTSPNTVIDVAIGSTTSDDNSTVMTLASPYTKTTGAWVVGTGNGVSENQYE